MTTYNIALYSRLSIYDYARLRGKIDPHKLEWTIAPDTVNTPDRQIARDVFKTNVADYFYFNTQK